MILESCPAGFRSSTLGSGVQFGTGGRYTGRFAPSPSGPLHMGSLLCAVISYLDARRNNGHWLVRIEDIDPPRQPAGTADSILRCLEAHGLHWDGQVLFQSSRTAAYQSQLDVWLREGLLYRCNCPRKRLSGLPLYDSHCRLFPPPETAAAALRVKVDDLPAIYQQTSSSVHFQDGIHGTQSVNLRHQSGDFIIHRKDGLYAYLLAGVLDEIEQGITHVVRGNDLLDTTARQIFLFRLLGVHPPVYAHFPVLTDARGLKLSKQNRAPALDNRSARQNLRDILDLLGIPLPENHAPDTCADLLDMAVGRFSLDMIRERGLISVKGPAKVDTHPTD